MSGTPDDISEDVAEVVSVGGSPATDGAAERSAVGTHPEGDEQSAGEDETVSEPGKVIRIGSMLKQLLDEVRQAPLDQASRERMKEIYEISVSELSSGLSPNLATELRRISFPFSGATPSEAELRVAQAQLVGWLEGLFHGIQATLFAQQMTARTQLEQMRDRGLPSAGGQNSSGPPGSGQYL